VGGGGSHRQKRPVQLLGTHPRLDRIGPVLDAKMGTRHPALVGGHANHPRDFTILFTFAGFFFSSAPQDCAGVGRAFLRRGGEATNWNPLIGLMALCCCGRNSCDPLRAGFTGIFRKPLTNKLIFLVRNVKSASPAGRRSMRSGFCVPVPDSPAFASPGHEKKIQPNSQP